MRAVPAMIMFLLAAQAGAQPGSWSMRPPEGGAGAVLMHAEPGDNHPGIMAVCGDPDGHLLADIPWQGEQTRRLAGQDVPVTFSSGATRVTLPLRVTDEGPTGPSVRAPIAPAHPLFDAIAETGALTIEADGGTARFAGPGAAAAVAAWRAACARR